MTNQSTMDNTRMDCVQLINALDVCEFMFNKPEERKEFELICV